MNKNSIIILFFLVLYSCDYKEIEKSRGDTIGQIIGKKQNYNSCAYYAVYTYKVDNIVYTNRATSLIHCRNFRYFENKYFPVVFSKKNPKKSLILIFPDYFEDWNVKFPDSLNWVLDKTKF
jgi:hypothetical protein